MDQGLIYIEYISRLPGVPLSEFHKNARAGQEGWAREHPEDKLLWNVGRTWRMGPEPEYVAVWWTPNSGFERLDYWDRVFRSGKADDLEDPFQRVARIQAAGCYEALLEPSAASGGTYYAEFFKANGDLGNACKLFQERAARHKGFTLSLLVYRIGKLGPEPGGLAVWTVPNFTALSEIAAELDNVHDPVELLTAGTYADLGREIL